MATAQNANDQASNSTKTVDASLWWDSFALLLTELENVSLSSDLPSSLEKKLKENHARFLDTVNLFKPPNQKSREALDVKQVKIGSRLLTIQPELKDAALKTSSVLCLDEVQSYILVERSVERNAIAIDSVLHEFHHLVMVQYYIERQCLLKCTRQILMHALYVGSKLKGGHAIWEEAQKLMSDGLESRLLSTLEELLSSNYPEQMDVDLYALWAEETLVEDIVVLDILFLAYYESFCTCNSKHWKKLLLLYKGAISGSSNFQNLSISAEAIRLTYYVKVQLLLILIETLDMENLLQMIHDEIPFRQGSVAFSMVDVQEMDAMVSDMDAFQTKEAGLLILAWAVFLCLISALPEKEYNPVVMEIDHVTYVRQAVEAASLNYFLEILESNVLKESDGPTAGYHSVLRTFISSFVASYEISLQLEDDNLKLILDILYKIYRGEESLCIQFWDRDSFVDGPIRCLLCSLEGEFPFRAVEFVRLLSALAEGTWPAECVYDFLDKSVQITSLFEIRNDSVVDQTSRMVKTCLPMHVPGVQGLIIPSGTRGQVLRLLRGNTAVVRWEYAQSGVVVLILRLAQELYLESSEEVVFILDLLSRMVTFNMAVCYALMVTDKSCDEVSSVEGRPEKYLGVNVTEMICTLVKNLPPTCYGAAVMSMGVNILAKMLKCSPYSVSAIIMRANIFDVALQTNPFDVGSNGLSSGTWLLSGRLAKMLLIDCEHSDCSLTLSVMDFTIQLVETGVENDIVLALVIFSLQYVLVNHDVWTYKVKHARWKVTLKALDVVKKCILLIPYREKLGDMVQDILLCDSSIHSALFQIVCTTAQGLEKLYISRTYELIDIEGLQLAISSGLDVLSSMLSVLSKGISNSSVFRKAILSPLTKPFPVVAAVISLISYFQNSKIQVAAARLLSLLFAIGDAPESSAFANACLGLDDKQISQFRNSVYSILSGHSLWNEELVIATLKLLSSAACYQPAFLAAVVALPEGSDAQLSNSSTEKLQIKADIKLMGLKDANIVEALLQFVRKSDDLIKSKPNVLLNVLNFLRALWQGAPQFTNILQQLKNSEKFWGHLFDSVILISEMPDNPSESLSQKELQNLAYRYYCQSDALEIIAYELFLHKKFVHAELLLKETSDSSKDKVDKPEGSRLRKDGSTQGLMEFLSTTFDNSLGKLIKAYASCRYDYRMHLRAKVAASLFSVHAMEKLLNGEMGSLSMLLGRKILTLSDKLRNLPAFSELLTRYKQHNYSQGKELQHLILSDLFYHLQGEFEGRQIDERSFKELLQYLLQSNFLPTYLCKCIDEFQTHAKDVRLYDLCRLQTDLALELWDLAEWKESKAVADKMLHCLEDVNGKVLFRSSKLSAMKAFVAMLSLYSDDLTKNGEALGKKMPEQLISSSLDHVCQCLHSTTETLGPDLDASEDVLDVVATQVELLLHLMKFLGENLSIRTCLLVLKTSGQCLKVLSAFSPSDAGVRGTMKLLLMLILFSVKLNYKESHSDVRTAIESIEDSAEVSNMSLGLLPILCHCIQFADHCALSLTTIDIILRSFSTPGTWFPVIQKHLQLHYVVQRLQDKNSANIPIVLEFLLTLSRVREGAKMLVDASFFASLRGVLAEVSDDGRCSVAQMEMSLSNALNKIEKPKHIWGLGLAVVTSVIQSLGDSTLDSGVFDYVMTHLLVEKAYLISSYLSAPDFPSDDHDKKRARSLKRRTSLSTLKETEQTLLLMCVLARHQNSWNKSMKEIDSQLREKSIHLLAFISRGIQHHGELPGRVAPLLCHPVLKEEFEWYKKPSFINSRNGWFVLSPLGCGLDPKFSSLSSRSSAFIVKDQSNDHAAAQTHFSDITAIQIYRIAFLLLKFLCIQAEAATKRAEELGFVETAHFPELPMPDILHGLQDQGIAIVSELCEAYKLKQATPEMQGICLLLLQITTMALYLEFCVIQVCGMRPVLGHTEDFLKELRLLIQATERHTFLKETMKSLKQIVSFVYPEVTTG